MSVLPAPTHMGAFRMPPNVVFGKASGFAANIDVINLTTANNNGFKISGAGPAMLSGRAGRRPHRH
jgi:hypothetical protein